MNNKSPYEIKFIAYNKAKTTRTTQIKALVFASNSARAKKHLEQVIKECTHMEEIVIKSCKKMNFGMVLIDKG